jgi:coenzyme F420-reducing hydrogenase alpha subunit
MTVGGFTHFPERAEMVELRQRLVAARADVDETVALFATLPWPEFERDTEYVSLTKPEEYAFIDGEIVTSDGARFPIEAYQQVTNEHLVQHSSAKHTRHRRESYMVGALARFNNNFALLHPRAKSAAAALALTPKVTNPYLNTAAQVVEIVHCVEDAIEILDQLIERGVHPERPAVPAGEAGEGVGACEVPRGILFHHYWIGSDGKMSGANCIIPTNQNLANLEADMRALVPQILDKPAQSMQLDLEMLVRAYDPCISCSVHVLRLDPEKDASI